MCPLLGLGELASDVSRREDRSEIKLIAESKQRLKVQRLLIAPAHWSPAIDQGLARLPELSRGEYSAQACNVRFAR